MKVVINACFGGFNLSYKAMMRYAELKGIKLYAFVDGRDSNGHIDFDHLVPYAGGGNPFCIHYSTEPLDENGHIKEETYFSDDDIPRDDPLLIRVVEELGEKAGGACASLKVIDIPDGTEWQIEEYDGLEHVAEKHRIWD